MDDQPNSDSETSAMPPHSTESSVQTNLRMKLDIPITGLKFGPQHQPAKRPRKAKTSTQRNQFPEDQIDDLCSKFLLHAIARTNNEQQNTTQGSQLSPTTSSSSYVGPTVGRTSTQFGSRFPAYQDATLCPTPANRYIGTQEHNGYLRPLRWSFSLP